MNSSPSKKQRMPYSIWFRIWYSVPFALRFSYENTLKEISHHNQCYLYNLSRKVSCSSIILSNQRILRSNEKIEAGFWFNTIVELREGKEKTCNTVVFRLSTYQLKKKNIVLIGEISECKDELISHHLAFLWNTFLSSFKVFSEKSSVKIIDDHSRYCNPIYRLGIWTVSREIICYNKWDWRKKSNQEKTERILRATKIHWISLSFVPPLSVFLRNTNEELRSARMWVEFESVLSE